MLAVDAHRSILPFARVRARDLRQLEKQPPRAAMAYRAASSKVCEPIEYGRSTALLDELGSQTTILVRRDRARCLQLVELYDFVGCAESYDMAQLFPGLAGLRLVSLGHAPSLG